MKTTWNVLAFLAVMNMIALILLGSWLFTSGRLDHQRVEVIRELVAVPVDEERRAAAAAEEEVRLVELARLEEESLVRLPLGSDAKIDAVEDLVRMEQRLLRRMEEDNERRVRALQQVERQLAEREKNLEGRIAEFQAMQAEHVEKTGRDSFLSVVKLLESLPARQAKDQVLLMMASGDADEAVASLRAMRSGPRTEIIAAMKSEEEKKLASDLLERLRAPSLPGGLTEIADAERAVPAQPN
ncbi:MAG: hypothetical protein MK082_11900 [Phycisphaerales bacterium]|nr:hypothetical protein [Phycisphaerales bacterium]